MTSSAPTATSPHIDLRALRETLTLTGHYQGQVEAFYWELRRMIRRFKAVNPELTIPEVQTLLLDDIETLQKPWQATMLHILTADSSLVTAAFDDYATSKAGQR